MMKIVLFFRSTRIFLFVCSRILLCIFF